MKYFLFDYQKFIEELRNDPDKSEIILNYEKYFGSLDDKDIEDTEFYQEYLSKFKMDERILFKYPSEDESDFDWDLLYKLVFASFSSNYRFDLSESWKNNARKPIISELIIKVSSEDKIADRTLSELWSFQILRLFEIYVEEQLNFSCLMKEEEIPENPIIQERETRILRFNLRKEQLIQEAQLYLLL